MGWIIYGILMLIFGYWIQTTTKHEGERNFMYILMVFVAITLGMDIAEFVGFER